MMLLTLWICQVGHDRADRKSPWRVVNKGGHFADNIFLSQKATPSRFWLKNRPDMRPVCRTHEVGEGAVGSGPNARSRLSTRLCRSANSANRPP